MYHSKKSMSIKLRKEAGDVLTFALLAVGALFMIVPLIWMFSSSLKTTLEIFDLPPKWIPEAPRWENYLNVWKMDVPLAQGFLNSAIISVSVVVIGTLTSAIAAFAFAKLRFPAKEKFFMFLLATLMIPFAIVMIPQFVIYTKIGWIDTWYPLIVPGLLGNVAMIFFLRQYMSGIPTSMVESARIDGASYWRIFWRIILPNARPAIAAQAILWFMAIWNDYFAPSIYINTPAKAPIQVVIAMFNSYYAIRSDYAMIMTASIISMIPVLAVFMIFQKQIIRSVAMTGLK